MKPQIALGLFSMLASLILITGCATRLTPPLTLPPNNTLVSTKSTLSNGNPNLTDRTLPYSIKSATYISIPEFKALDDTSGSITYNVGGYVSYIYTCPPCPKDAECKPCMGNNIIISEADKRLEDYYSLSDSDIVVFVDEPNQLKLGGLYEFSLIISPSAVEIPGQTTIPRLVGYTEAGLL